MTVNSSAAVWTAWLVYQRCPKNDVNNAGGPRIFIHQDTARSPVPADTRVPNNQPRENSYKKMKV